MNKTRTGIGFVRPTIRIFCPFYYDRGWVAQADSQVLARSDRWCDRCDLRAEPRLRPMLPLYARVNRVTPGRVLLSRWFTGPAPGPPNFFFSDSSENSPTFCCYVKQRKRASAEGIEYES